jgi:hypothetical protein
MNYTDTLQAVDTMKALSLIGIEGGQSGSYIHYPCTKCNEGKAVIRAYGDKKNVWYCPACKRSGQIISLLMEVKEMPWDEAKQLLTEKAITYPASKVTKEIPITYDLEYDKYLELQGISEEVCNELGIGRPKGKTMLSGCIAFAVYDELDKKIAYYGIRVKDGKPIFHHSFNPELYLYNFNRIDTEQEVQFTTDMLDCVKLLSIGEQAVCNFGLPYLSNTHFALLNKCKYVSFSYEIKNLDEISVQAVKNLQNFMRVLKK